MCLWHINVLIRLTIKNVMQGKLIAVDNFDNSHNSFLWPEYFIDYLCERWIPCQASTSVLCLHYRPVTVHCITKDAYTSEITFLALNPCLLYSFYLINELCILGLFKLHLIFAMLKILAVFYLSWALNNFIRVTNYVYLLHLLHIVFSIGTNKN